MINYLFIDSRYYSAHYIITTSPPMSINLKFFGCEHVHVLCNKIDN